MDRNERRHLPGYDEMIARGLQHQQQGGPDHLDAISVPSEPIGTVFGLDVESVSPAADLDDQPDPFGFSHHSDSHYTSQRPSYGQVEPDCVPASRRELPPQSPEVTRLSHGVDPHKASMVDKLLQKQELEVGMASCDSGIFSGSINSACISSSSRDETNFIPSIPMGTSIPSSVQASAPVPEGLADSLQNLSIGRDRVSITQEPVSPPLVSSDHDLNLPPALSPVLRDSNPQDLAELTERFKRNLRYIEQDNELDTNLHLLIYADKDEAVLNLLDDLISYQFLDIANRRKQTILHVAVLMNKPVLCRSIMAHGAAVDSRDDQGNTPLHLACDRGYTECVQVLTKHLDYHEVKDMSYQVPFRCIPQSLELRNYEGFTCLHLAAVKGHFDIVHYLVHDLSADVNAPEGKRGMTALMLCADQRNAQMLMYLVQQCGANIHLRTYDRKNATELAAGRGFTEIANLLKAVGGESEKPEDLEEDWIEEDFDDFTVNGQVIGMDQQ